MKVLIVASGNHTHMAPFVEEQGVALQQAGAEVRILPIEGHRAAGYLHNLPLLRQTIRDFRPQVVHAHYGLCGLLCTLQNDTPVAITYHGSDLTHPLSRILARIAARRAQYNIFVARHLQAIANAPKTPSSILPCGIDLDLFSTMETSEARKAIGLSATGAYVLFAGAFNNPVKNAPLAQQSVALIPHTKLIELNNYSRKEVHLLMCACNVLLMTSHSEGSPQVVKEAMACGLPIVSVDVGDVGEWIDTPSGTIATPTPEALAQALLPYLEHPRRTEARSRVAHLDNKQIAIQLLNIYSTLTH